MTDFHRAFGFVDFLRKLTGNPLETQLAGFELAGLVVDCVSFFLAVEPGTDPAQPIDARAKRIDTEKGVHLLAFYHPEMAGVLDIEAVEIEAGDLLGVFLRSDAEGILIPFGAEDDNLKTVRVTREIAEFAI